jgi:hypothetical protein
VALVRTGKLGGIRRPVFEKERAWIGCLMPDEFLDDFGVSGIRTFIVPEMAAHPRLCACNAKPISPFPSHFASASSGTIAI